MASREGTESAKGVVWNKSFLNPTVSWKTARRVVPKVEYHCGEQFPRVRLIATKLETNNGTGE